MMGRQPTRRFQAARFFVTKSNLITLYRTDGHGRKEANKAASRGRGHVGSFSESTTRASPFPSRDVTGVFKQNIPRTDGRTAAALQSFARPVQCRLRRHSLSNRQAARCVSEASALTSTLTQTYACNTAAHSR